MRDVLATQVAITQLTSDMLREALDINLETGDIIEIHTPLEGKVKVEITEPPEPMGIAG